MWRDGLWCIACVRELTPEGWCEQVLARIDDRGPAPCRLTDWRVLHPEGPRLHQKNWMPRVAGDALQFVYLCDPTRFVDDQARTIAETVPPIAADQFRGGSQLISFDGGWLALVHEARVLSNGERYYRHRFVWFDEATRLRGVSRPFFLQKRGVEFAAGLAWHPDGKRLIVTYGVADSEAWIATVDAGGSSARFWRMSSSFRQGAPETAVAAGKPVRRWDIAKLGARRRQVRKQASPKVVGPRPAKCDGLDAECEGKRSRPCSRRPRRCRGRRSNPTEEAFFKLAPFLRAADSPQERRRLSRDFDARIAPSWTMRTARHFRRSTVSTRSFRTRPNIAP